MLIYPKNGHKTDSKTIYFFGSASESCSIQGQSVSLYANGNFSHQVDLQSGKNDIEVSIDNNLEHINVELVAAESISPVAYAQNYQAEINENSSKVNKLTSILIYQTKIRIPLNTAPIYSYKRVNTSKFIITFTDLNLDLDWVVSDNCSPNITIDIKQNKSELDILIEANYPIKVISDNWDNNYLEFDLIPYSYLYDICIDPGHGGEQTGAISPKGIMEKDINLNLSLKLKAELEKLGLKCICTREEDIYLPLTKRVEITKQAKAKYFISIHHNALPDARDPALENGFSCHYYHAFNKNFAQYIYEKLTEFIEIPPAKFYMQNLHVLRENTFSNSLLVEMGYLIHPTESELITNDKYIERTVKVLAKAIYNYNRFRSI